MTCLATAITELKTYIPSLTDLDAMFSAAPPELHFYWTRPFFSLDEEEQVRFVRGTPGLSTKI